MGAGAQWTTKIFEIKRVLSKKSQELFTLLIKTKGGKNGKDKS